MDYRYRRQIRTLPAFAKVYASKRPAISSTIPSPRSARALGVSVAAILTASGGAAPHGATPADDSGASGVARRRGGDGSQGEAGEGASEA